jgi:DNA-binding transcriptional LysR family regulator
VTLEQLRIFLVVASKQHVTQAAEVLHLTQSAVSASIAAIEARHEVRLFDRVGRGIRLTEAGRLFVPQAEALLAQARTVELFLADVGGQAMGTVRIHASQTVANYWLPPRLVWLQQNFPRIQVELTAANTAQVAQSVHDGAADLGVVEGYVHDPELDRHRVGFDRLVLIVGRDHPWARRTSVTMDELNQTKWVLREEGSGTRSEFAAALDRLGIKVSDLEVSLMLPSNEAVCAAVSTGIGASVLSERVALQGVAAGRLVAIDLGLPERDFVALTHRERYRTRALQALLSALPEAGA